MVDGGAQTRLVFAAWLDAERRCARCDEVYCERDNLGVHECALHPLPLLGKTHRCCGRARGEPGCCAADHVDQWTINTEHQRVAEGTLFGERHTTVLGGDRFAMLADTPSGAAAYRQAHSWREHPNGGYEIERVDLAAWHAARNTKCRAMPSARAALMQ